MPITVDSLVHRLRDLPQDGQVRSLSDAVDGGEASRGAALEVARRLGLGSDRVGQLLAATGADGRDRVDRSVPGRALTTGGARDYAGGYHDLPATRRRPLGVDTVLGARLGTEVPSTSARALAAHWDRHLDNPPFAGTAAVLGGALHSDALFAAMVEAARGDGDPAVRPRIAVVVSSKPDQAAATEAYYKDEYQDGEKVDDSIEHWFQGMGFDPVLIPATIDRPGAGADPALVDAVRGCDAVYLCGGAQWRHTRCLLDASGADTPLMGAIRELLQRGGLVSGSSAGGHTQGAIQYGVGDAYDYMKANQLDAEDMQHLEPSRQAGDDPGPLQMGTGLIGRLGVVTCTHFDRRHRLGRLLVALREVDRLRQLDPGDRVERALGVGVDEDTGLFIEGEVGRVHGDNGVFVVDASEAVFGDGPRFSVTGLRLHYLTAGDSYDFARREVSSDKQPPRGDGRPYSSDDLMRRYDMTRLIEGLVRSGEAQAVGRTAEDDPRFTFVLSRDDQTRLFDGDDRVAAQGLLLDVTYD